MKRLHKNAIILLLLGMFFSSAYSVAATFANVYFIRITNDLGIMILQNITSSAAILCAFILGSFLSKKLSITTIIRIGLVSIILYYSAILLLKDNVSKYLIILGFFNGLGTGFYYFSFNIIVGKSITEQELPVFFSYQTSVSYIFGVILPSITGLIIVKFSQLTGYYVLFFVSVLLYCLAILLSFFLKNVKFVQHYELLPIIKMKNNLYWNTNKYFSFSYGMRETVYHQIYTVFVYTIITNEQLIGNLGSLMSLLGIISATFITSRFTIENQSKYYLLAGVIYLLSLGSLAIFANTWAVILVYIAIGVISCWISVTFSSMKYQLSNRSNRGYKAEDYVIASEFPIAAGRISGLLISYIINYLIKGQFAYRIILLLISIIIIIDYFVIKKKVGWLNDNRKKQTE